MRFAFNENITVDPDCNVMLYWNPEGPGIYMGVLPAFDKVFENSILA